MSELPKISIVTPSFNQGAFLEETIRSVLDQNYPALEYIIIDGGSSDNSVDIIKQYADRLAYWTSAKDNGQTDALNKGFRMATGDIVAYLNSDDLYLPGSLARVAKEFSDNAKCRWLTGSCIFFRSEGGEELIRPTIPASLAPWLREWVIPQPAVFWRRELFASHGLFDERYNFCMDYEFWLRLLFGGERCYFVEQTFAKFRFHSSSKSVGSTQSFIPEAAAIRRRYRKKLSAQDRQELASLERSDLLERCRKHYDVAMTAAVSGSRRKAAKQLMAAAKLYPRSILSRQFLTGTRFLIQALTR